MEYSDEFMPIQNLDLEQDREVHFDLFLGLKHNQKMILYRREGKVLESESLERFRQQEAVLFIRRDDYMKFVTYVSERIGRLLHLAPGNDERRIISGVVRGMLQGTFDEDPVLTNMMMRNLNEVAAHLIDRVLSEQGKHGRKTFRRMMDLASTGSSFQKHPVNVASMATMLALGLGLASDKGLSEIAIASLLHDLGLTKVPVMVAQAAHDREAEQLLNLEGRVLLQRHIVLGLDLINEKKIEIGDLCRLMIEQHHELFNGSGYPKRLRGGEINTFAQILHIADRIDEAIFAKRSPNPLADLYRLIETWSEQKMFDPLLIARIRLLFFIS